MPKAEKGLAAVVGGAGIVTLCVSTQPVAFIGGVAAMLLSAAIFLADAITGHEKECEASMKRDTLEHRVPRCICSELKKS